MAFIKTPSAGTPYFPREVMRAFLGIFSNSRPIDLLEQRLGDLFGVRHVMLTNSGTTSFYLLLKVLARLHPQRKQIIMPAYTAPSLILPIKEAGLSARLVDMSMKTFNMDVEKIHTAIDGDTLAVMPVHMFGIPIDVEALLELERTENIPIIEDAASSMGSRVRGKYVGTISDMGFFSFNRGKNVSTLHGGFIQVKDDDLMQFLRKEIDKLPVNSLLGDAVTALKILALSLAVQPVGYTLLQPLVSKFKYTTLHTHFDSFKYPLPNAEIGLSLIRRMQRIFGKRVENGKIYLRSLKGIPGIRTPEIPDDFEVAFNQFPLLVDDLDKRERLQKLLLKKGIETTILYPYAVHQVFPEYARKPEDFPHALYFAGHILLLPVHPSMSIYRIQTVIQTIKEIFS